MAKTIDKSVAIRGEERYRELLKLAAAIMASDVATLVRDAYLRHVLHDARRCSFANHVPIIGITVIDNPNPGGGWTSIGDSDPETSKYPGDEADCIYIDFPPYAFGLYVDSLFESGALKRGDAIKRAGTNGTGMRDTINYVLRNGRGACRFTEFVALCRATGHKPSREGTREFIAKAREWYLANEHRIEWYEPSPEKPGGWAAPAYARLT